MARPYGDDRDFQGTRRGSHPGPVPGARRRRSGGSLGPRRPREGRLRIPERTLSVLAAGTRAARPDVGRVRGEPDDRGPRGTEAPHRDAPARRLGPVGRDATAPSLLQARHPVREGRHGPAIPRKRPIGILPGGPRRRRRRRRRPHRTDFRTRGRSDGIRGRRRGPGGGTGGLVPANSSDSTPSLEDRVAEPDERRLGLELLRLREERPEPRVAIVLLVGLVIRSDDVKDVILDAASLLASAARTDEASLEEPTSAREVVPDRDLLGLEHRFEIRRTIGRNPEDNRGRLRRLGRGDFGFPSHASTMLEGLLKSKPVTGEKGLPVSRDGPAMHSNIARERASHPKPTVLSDFILGSQDGIVNVLGIILGLSAATRDIRIILVATLAALGAESIAMGAVAYTSTRARRRLYLSQVVQERREMKEIPQTERDEVREILTGWGYQGADLEEIVERICRNPTAELEFMMSF